MDKKFLIIAVVAVILIVTGAVLIFSSSEKIVESADIPLKTHDFKLFEIDTPKGSDFKIKNEADGMKYYQNKGNYSDAFSGIIINKNLTDSLIGDNVVPISNSSNEQIYSFSLKNKTNYKCVIRQDKADIILIGEDLNLLKEISQTIKIKDSDNL